MIYLLNILCLIFYGVASFLLARQLVTGSGASATTRKGVLSTGALAVLAHAIVLYANLPVSGQLNLALTHTVSLVTWFIAFLFLVAMVRNPIETLGVLVMPLAALGVLLSWFWPGIHILSNSSSPYFVAHVASSIVAYSLISLGGAQSILLLVQERHLKSKHPGGFIKALPPMETMEGLMVQLVTMGFILLTLTVASGAVFSEEVFGRPLQFNHHIFLSLLGWLVFAVFLVGRWYYGWRGRTAVHWVLWGCVLVALGYFGTKFVLEILLHR